MKNQHENVSIDEVRERLAVNLRRLRAERAISQERLALEAGVDRTMLSKIERRISNPSIETLLKLANRLAVDLAAIVAPTEDSGAPHPQPVPVTPGRKATGRHAVHEPRPRSSRSR